MNWALINPDDLKSALIKALIEMGFSDGRHTSTTINRATFKTKGQHRKPIANPEIRTRPSQDPGIREIESS